MGTDEGSMAEPESIRACRLPSMPFSDLEVPEVRRLDELVEDRIEMSVVQVAYGPVAATWKTFGRCEMNNLDAAQAHRGGLRHQTGYIDIINAAGGWRERTLVLTAVAHLALKLACSHSIVLVHLRTSTELVERDELNRGYWHPNC